jgi:hypothetical protein
MCLGWCGKNLRVIQQSDEVVLHCIDATLHRRCITREIETYTHAAIAQNQIGLCQ